MKVVLLDVYKQAMGEPFFNVIEISGELDELYQHLRCDCIDIVNRRIGNRHYDIIADDEGLLKDGNIVSALEMRFREKLVGNLIICKHNSQCEMIGLTDEEIEEVKAAVVGIVGLDGEFAIHKALLYLV